MADLSSTAEHLAAEGERLGAFQDLNLLGVKNKVEDVLSLIGKEGFFSEFTLHDITHINKMLGMLDWLVIDSTRTVMTPADWLLTVLAVYFHDMGLLVTKAEFDARDESDFGRFCEEVLFAGEDGAEYKSKVGRLEPSDAERFLYQEFVREHHAARIAEWIRGQASRQRGVSAATAEEVDRVLTPLPPEFRHDLAIVCESHHLTDLGDTREYRVARPYGDSDEETANVQYAAVLLRTADLLHITSDRTPSTLFRVINPQDPVSQREWAKQRAVRRVRPKRGRDSEGNFSDAAPKDTIEVHASFSDADGLFFLG